MATSTYLPMVSNSRPNGGRSQTQYPLTAAQMREANNSYNMAKASTPKYRVAAPPPPLTNLQYFPLVVNNQARTYTPNAVGTASYPLPLLTSDAMVTAPVTAPATTSKAKSTSRSYYPTSVYGGGSGSGGGGSAAAYEQYGITSPWMDAYKSVWGKELSPKLYGLVNPVTSLFTRYMNRLPQLEDWNMIWAAAKQYYANNEIKADQMPLRLEVYEPLIAAMRRQPLFTPPTISYAPQLSF